MRGDGGSKNVGDSSFKCGNRLKVGRREKD